MYLRTEDQALVPDFCAALPVVAEEQPDSKVDLIRLWLAADQWATSNGHRSFPLGSFRRLVLSTGYAVSRGRRGQYVYGLALRTTY